MWEGFLGVGRFEVGAPRFTQEKNHLISIFSSLLFLLNTSPFPTLAQASI